MKKDWTCGEKKEVGKDLRDYLSLSIGIHFYNISNKCLNISNGEGAIFLKLSIPLSRVLPVGISSPWYSAEISSV